MIGIRDKSYALLALVLVMAACASAPAPPPSQPSPVTMPEWLTGKPVREGMICAVGASEPTYFMADAKKYAAESARAELSRTIRTEIRSVMIDVATNRGSNTEEATVSQTSSWITEQVVEHAQILEYWFDALGTASPKKNVTYALCCMPKSDLQR